MHTSNINPVQRPENAASVRRRSSSNDHRDAARHSLSGGNSEKEQVTESGNGGLENDQYDAMTETESAILSDIAAAELKRPSMVAAHVLQLREENYGHHG